MAADVKPLLSRNVPSDRVATNWQICAIPREDAFKVIVLSFFSKCTFHNHGPWKEEKEKKNPKCILEMTVRERSKLNSQRGNDCGERPTWGMLSCVVLRWDDKRLRGGGGERLGGSGAAVV